MCIRDRLAGGANRTLSKAQAFAERYGVEKVYGTVEDLYADPDIDAVYITTVSYPHLDVYKRQVKQTSTCRLPSLAEGRRNILSLSLVPHAKEST